jgi:hypothetical protein
LHVWCIETERGGFVVPATGAETYAAGKVVGVALAVVVECVGADLEDWRHVDLSFSRVCGEQTTQFWILQGATDALFGWRSVDFRLQGFGYADADAFFAD